jgi:hypothetical protein
MNSVRPSRVYACSIPKHDKAPTVAGTNGLNRLTTVGGVGEGNAMDSPMCRSRKDDATPSIASEKVSAAPVCDATGRGAAIPDLTEFRRERDNTAPDPRANNERQ